MVNRSVRFATKDDAGFIDSVIRLRGVKEMIVDTDEIGTIEPLIGDHIFIVCEGGFLYAEPLGDCDFGCIAAFDNEHHGLYSIMATREAIRMVFTETEAKCLVGTAYKGDIDITRMWRAIGFRKISETDSRYIGQLDYLTWSINDREMRYVGETFASKFGIKCDNPCNAYNSALGALVVSVANQNIVKAVHQHNLFSVGAGTAPLTVFLGEELRFNYGGADFSERDIINFVTGEGV